MAGKIVYPSGDPAAVTYVLPRADDFGRNYGYMEANDNSRGLDGGLNAYIGPKKKFYNLVFSYVTKAQADYFIMLWTFGCAMDLYLDGVNFDATVMMVDTGSGGAITCPNPKAEETDPITYSFSVRFEEI